MTRRLTADLAFRLPEERRHKGEPSAWARMTRPGQEMHSFLEAAFFDDNRNLWLSDVPYGRVFRITPAGVWEIMHRIDGEPHAMRIAPDGRHIAVDYRHGLIALTGPDSFEVLSAGLEHVASNRAHTRPGPDPGPRRADAEAPARGPGRGGSGQTRHAPKGQPFLGLSDMCYGSDGRLWFTDSGRTSLSDPRGGVYCLSPSGDLRLLLDCVPYSNGICLSPDGDWLYVAATRANQVWRLSTRLPETGQPMAGTFLQLSGGLGPDGLATNARGWLAVAQAQAGRAYVFDALGDPVAEIRLPEGLWTTSVVFHPDTQTRLYIVDAQTGSVFTSDIPD